MIDDGRSGVLAHTENSNNNNWTTAAAAASGEKSRAEGKTEFLNF